MSKIIAIEKWLAEKKKQRMKKLYCWSCGQEVLRMVVSRGKPKCYWCRNEKKKEAARKHAQAIKAKGGH